MKRYTVSVLLIVAVWAGFSVCDTSVAQSTPNFSQNIQRIISKFDSDEYRNIHGFLVWKNGEIIGERYRDPWNSNRPHSLQSVTKSITSLLIGIAIKEGHIPDIEQAVLDFFPGYHSIQNLDARKRALTLEDLLTMRSGMEWVEPPYQGSPLARMNARRDDWVGFVLDTPMREMPGQTYLYNSGGVILLGGVIRNTAGMAVQEFASRYLFEPLGIASAEWWFSDRTGLPHTGGGLSMAASDMLKIGRLVLQCGQWEKQRILNCGYVKRLFENHQTEPISEVGGYSRGYSLLWHLFPVDPDSGIDDSPGHFLAAWGAEGQWIMVFPGYNMIAVFTGGTQNFNEEIQPLRIVYEELLQR